MQMFGSAPAVPAVTAMPAPARPAVPTIAAANRRRRRPNRRRLVVWVVLVFVIVTLLSRGWYLGEGRAPRNWTLSCDGSARRGLGDRIDPHLRWSTARPEGSRPLP